MIKFLKPLLLPFGLIFFIASCKKMDSPYRKFVVPGGLTYPEKANDAVVFAGRNRVKIAWLRGSDPNVTKAGVFWNDYTDSVEVNIPPIGDTISVIIENLPEKTYTFDIKTYDEKGNISVPVELLSAAYGDQYQSGLLATLVDSSSRDDAGNITINWSASNISGGAFATEVKYIDSDRDTIFKQFQIDGGTSTIKDVKEGTTFQFRTMYLPDSLSIDTFYTAYQQNKESFFEKNTWKVIDFSSERAPANDLAADVIDGSLVNRWVSASTSQYPHFVTIDMKTERTITTFEVYNQAGNNQMCDTFQLFVGDDTTRWSNLGTFAFDINSTSGVKYDIPSHPKARYIKFVGLSGPKNFILVGEISVYGY